MGNFSLTRSKGGRAIVKALKLGALGFVAWQGKGCWDSYHSDPNDAQLGRVNPVITTPPVPRQSILPNFERSKENFAKNARDTYKVPVEYDKKNILYVGSGLPSAIGDKPILNSKDEGDLIPVEPAQTQALAQVIQKHEQRKQKLGTNGQLYIVFLPRVKDDSGNEIRDKAHIIGYDVPNATKPTYAIDLDTGFVYSEAITEREQSQQLLKKLFAMPNHQPVDFFALERDIMNESLDHAKRYGTKIGEKTDGHPELKYGEIRWTSPTAEKKYGLDAEGDLPTPRSRINRGPNP